MLFVRRFAVLIKYFNIWISAVGLNTVTTVRRRHGSCATKKCFIQTIWSVCGFGRVSPERFVLSTFNCNGFSGPYILYRCMIALYQFLWTLLIVREWGNEPHYTPTDQKWKIVLFISYWSYFVLTMYFIFAAIAVLVYHYIHNADKSNNNIAADVDSVVKVKIILKVVDENERNNNISKGLTCKPELPYYFSFVWLLQVLAYSTSIGVTILYWIQERCNNIFGAHVHGINVLLCIIDAIVIANPYRFYHFIYTSLFCLSYILFTVIFWTFGGLNHKGYTYIYKDYLDWENNVRNSLLSTCFVCFIVAPISHSFVWLFIKIKENVIQRNCTRKKNTRKTNDNSLDHGGNLDQYKEVVR